jgi:hypothetical protein
MKSRETQGHLRRAVVVVACVLAGLASSACGPGNSDTGSNAPTASPEPGGGLVEEETAKLGQSLEVDNLTATVNEVHRQKSFGPGIEAGYLVAQVTVANKSTAAQKYHRLDWELRLPDGSTTNRTPITGQTQVGQGDLEPGQQIAGQLIFMVEDKGGDFALMFEPRQQENKPEKQRGVWPFTSQPGDAR